MSTLLRNTNHTLLMAVAVLSFLGVSLLAFQGWMTHGVDIFLTLSQTGLSWCL
jgi:hypothetical protein